MEFNATFIVSVISFIVFTILMNQVFYAPISKIKEEREKIITDTLSEAEKSQKEADMLNTEHENKITQATSESKKIISITIDNANKESLKMTSEAKERSIIEIINQKQTLMTEAEYSRQELVRSAKVIANDIVNKILG